MENFLIFDYIQEGYVTSLRKKAYGTSRFTCDALLFEDRESAQSFVSILEQLFCDTHFVVMAFRS